MLLSAVFTTPLSTLSTTPVNTSDSTVSAAASPRITTFEGVVCGGRLLVVAE